MTHEYATQAARLTGRNAKSRKIANNTYMQRRDENTIALLYHETDVVTYKSSGDVILDSGGWRTYTTKERINMGLPSGFYLSQNRGQWILRSGSYSDTEAKEYLLQDGTTIHADGSVTGADGMDKIAANLKERRKAQRYAAGFIAAMRKGKVPPPSNGDCWYCLMREVNTGKPLGECSHGGSDHIQSHIAERYYVPSLLVRALEVMPSSIAMKDTVARKWRGEDGDGWGDFAWQLVQKALSRYVVRQLGQAA